MQTVYLNGGLSQFGEKWTTECKDIASIFKLIECQTPGFRKYLTDAVEADVGFEIQRGSEFLENPEELLLSLNEEDIIITEVPSGSKSGGAKILAAIAILYVTYVYAGPTAAAGYLQQLQRLSGTVLAMQQPKVAFVHSRYSAAII